MKPTKLLLVGPLLDAHKNEYTVDLDTALLRPQELVLDCFVSNIVCGMMSRV